MKKARLVLAAVALFTVVGAAFAFRAKSGDTYYITTDPTALATFTVTDATFTTNPAVQSVYWTTVFNVTPPSENYNKVISVIE